MIWSLMLFVLLWSLWLSASALLVERRLLAARVSVRFVWMGAIALSIFAPVAAFVFGNRSERPTTVDGAPRFVLAVPPLGVQSPGGSPRIDAPTAGHAVASNRPFSTVRSGAHWPLIPTYDTMLISGSFAASFLMLVYTLGGVLRLRSLRSKWTSGIIDDVAVMISESTGPAVVGVIRPAIVLPRCVLALEPQQLSLMLRHEAEHLAANDARLLAVAQIAIIVAPWNPLLWWQLRRLRLAVELDCDARVLDAFPDFVAYGSLLLQMGSGQRAVFSGAGFAQHAPQLESRIRRLTVRPRGRRWIAIATSAFVACVAVAAGCALPAPTKPAAQALSRVRLSSSPAIGNSAIVATLGMTPTSSVTSSVAEGGNITVSWDNAPILDVLSLLAKFGGKTILPSPRVTGFVSAYFVSVPWRSVLDSIASSNGYATIVNRDSSIVVDTFDSIAVLRGSPTKSPQGEASNSSFFNIRSSRGPQPAPGEGVSIVVRHFALVDLAAALAEASGRTFVGAKSIPGYVDAVLGHRNWEALLTRILDDHGYDVSFTSREVIVPDTSRDGARPATSGVTQSTAVAALLQRRWWSWWGAEDDTLDAANLEHGCSVQAGADPSEVVVLVNNAAVARGGHLVVQTMPTASSSPWVEFSEPNGRDQLCAVGRGVIRIVGFGANGRSPIVVRAGNAASLVVQTASGRVVAGPIQLKNEASAIALEWPAGIR